MGIKNRRHKLFNLFSRFTNKGDVVNGDKICNYYITAEECYKILTEKDNYSDFYKKYILKLSELEGYAFSLFYPQYNKKSFDFTSKSLVFGKKIIDWIYGLTEFPCEDIQDFYSELQTDFDFNDNSVIVKRWNANVSYFNSDIKRASENYSVLYDELLKCKNIPSWYLDDICIDGRNILYQYENMINKYSIENKFQVRLSLNKHKLSYPDGDRIKAEIFENVSNNIFNNKNKSKNTVIFGVGLEDCFMQIQNLVFLTIFYGSITHLKLVRELISSIMYMYADTFEDEEFYILTLRMLYLSGEFKKYRNLYDKIKLKYSFVISSDFIQSIINSRKSLFKFEEGRKNIFLFDIYGRYLDDDLYLNLEKSILNIITIKRDFNKNLVSDALKAITTNIKRSNNIGKLLIIMKDYFNNPYSIFYRGFCKILEEIDINRLTKTEFKDYQFIIDSLLKQKDSKYYDLSGCIIKIKKRDSKITKYDCLFSKGTHEDFVYQIEWENNEIEAIRYIVKVYKERHEEREKSPGLFYEHSRDYRIGTDVFTPAKYNGEIKKLILEEYLPLAQSIILSENEYIYEKCRHIKLLSHLFFVEDDNAIKDKITGSIQRAKEIKSCNYSFFANMRFRNKFDLDVNLLMIDVLAGNIKYEEALCFYLEGVIKSPDNIGEILDCVSTLNNLCKDKNDSIIEKLFFLFTFSYEINDVDVRNDIVEMSWIFIGTKYQKKILEILEGRINNIVFEECKGYIQLIMNIDEDKRELYAIIIEKLKTNKNYYVKYMANMYL